MKNKDFKFLGTGIDLSEGKKYNTIMNSNDFDDFDIHVHSDELIPEDFDDDDNDFLLWEEMYDWDDEQG